MKFIALILFAFLPSPVKIIILKSLGHQIGKNVYIGMSYLDIKTLSLGNNTSISHLNYFQNIQKIDMREGSRIGGKLNWFTASQNNNESNTGFGTLIIQEGSNITSRHYFDLQEEINIGRDSLIAGSNSKFYTHTVTPNADNINKKIIIGDKCYIGSDCLFLPGSAIGSNCFVGAGSVVIKDFFVDNNQLIAGNPAITKKVLDKDSKYFNSVKNSFIPPTKR